MNFNIKIFLLCPVPEDQKPINQYINLKENSFFKWTQMSVKNYIFQVFYGSFICFPLFLICFLNLTPFSVKEIEDIFLISSTIFFIILYFRWWDINQQFIKSQVFYEEASWFDGKVWQKPFFLIKNDKLLSSQKINPILNRLFFTLLLHFLLFCFLNV